MLRQILSLIMIGTMIELIVADAVVNRGIASGWLLAPLFILAGLIIVVGTLEQIYAKENKDES
jgi:uncharacterized membrane protein